MREIRLRALKDAPYAFCATHEEALKRPMEAWVEQCDRAAEGSSQAIFLVFNASEAVGIAAVCRTEEKQDEAEVFQVWIAPQARGMGLGRKLMDAVFAWADSAGYRRIFAAVTRTNEKAVAFYTRYSFEEVRKSESITKLVKETKQPGDAKPASAKRVAVNHGRD